MIPEFYYLTHPGRSSTREERTSSEEHTSSDGKTSPSEIFAMGIFLVLLIGVAEVLCEHLGWESVIGIPVVLALMFIALGLVVYLFVMAPEELMGTIVTILPLGYFVSEMLGLGSSRMQEMMIEFGVPIVAAGWLDGPLAVLFGVFCLAVLTFAIFVLPLYTVYLVNLIRERKARSTAGRA